MMDFTPPSIPQRGFWSRQPAAVWQESLLCGNGRMGGLVRGEPLDETITVAHEKLFLPLHAPLPPPDTAAHLPELRALLADGEYVRSTERVVEIAHAEGYEQKRWTDPFIPACDLLLSLPPDGDMHSYARSVDFETGVAAVRWEDNRGVWARRVFVSRVDNVVVMSCAGPAPFACRLRLAQTPADPQDAEAVKRRTEGVRDWQAQAAPGAMLARSRFAHSDGGYACAARVRTQGGTQSADGDVLSIMDADDLLVVLRVLPLPDFDSLDTEALQAELAALPTEFDALLERHAALHGPIFCRARLDLGGEADRALSSEVLLERARAGEVSPALLEKLFDAGRYVLLSGSGAWPPNLQGVWTGTWNAPWSGDYTLNGNAQTAIACALSTNMAECLLPFFRYLEELLPDLRENARRLYGARGIHVPSRASTHGLNNHFDTTWPMTFWTAGAGWCAAFFYEYYLFTGDRAFLTERALPFMKEAAFFYEDFLQTNVDGVFVFSPSYSPENKPTNSNSQACINAAMDISVARELLTNLIAACTQLDTDKEDVVRWQAMLLKLPPLLVNENGALQEWAVPFLEDDDTHRHCSHLYALYFGLPSDVKSDPALRGAYHAAAENRLAVRRREGGGIMAFGMALLGQAAASLRDANMAWEVVGWLAGCFWNTAFASWHDPGRTFNVDICGGLPDLMARMLVASAPGRIDLLPACPAAWPRGQAEELAARGQIVLQTLAWDGPHVTATLLSPIAQTVCVSLPGTIDFASCTGAVLTRPDAQPASCTVTLAAARPATLTLTYLTATDVFNHD